MERIGVRELRQNASRYISRVKAGETLGVSQRGTLVALLTPVTTSQTVRDSLIAAGRLIPASNPTGRLRSSRAVVVSEAVPSNRELLDAQRGERL